METEDQNISENTWLDEFIQWTELTVPELVRFAEDHNM